MTRFIPMFITFTVIQVLIDIYILMKWQNFIKKRKYAAYLYKGAWIIAIAALVINMFLTIKVFFDPMRNGISHILMLLTAIWYVPKLPIVIFLLIKDIPVVSARLIKRLAKHKPPAVTEEVPDSKRRKFLENAGWAAAGIPFAVVSYGALKTTYDFAIHRVDIPLLNLPPALDGLRIVQISDLHFGSFYSQKPFMEARFIINNLKPDILFITGDFVNFDPVELKGYYDELTKLRADYGIFACLGNHDHYMEDRDHKTMIKGIREAGIDLMINQHKTLTLNNSNINLASVDNFGMNQRFADFDLALKDSGQGDPTILLCHDPTNWDKFINGKKDVDLMLSGHTHGGQIGWEKYGLRLMPVGMRYKQCAGLYNSGDQYLYINRGLGTVGPPVRIGINPEITLITLKNANNYKYA